MAPGTDRTLAATWGPPGDPRPLVTLARPRLRDPVPHLACDEGASLGDAFRSAMCGASAASVLRASGAVAVAVFDVSDWRPFLPEAMRVVDPEADARAARQRDPRNAEALLLAYALHRLVLAWMLDCAPAAVPLRRDAKGCPRLAGDRMHTSLSHAGTRVAIAATTSGPVGIDIEPDVRAGDMPELIGHVAHPEEQRALRKLPAHAQGPALLGLWVRKEALLKAAGIGLEREMRTFLAPPDVALPLPDGSFPGHCATLRMLDAGRGWTMAVAGPPAAGVCHVATPPGH